ncbi:MAG: CDP-glycerol glycerophosphotransferase family protein [Erysipelotrichaceae bacterium]|nr:CDP-glycerol glycerophosphotransferase family protein [Erysipelotrichaceae bacterium]
MNTKTINGITWNRFFLQLGLDKDGTLVATGKKNTPLVLEEDGAVNMANATGHSVLEAGEYYLEYNGQRLCVNAETARHIDDYSKVFYYGKDAFAYIVSFQAEVVEQSFVLVMKTAFMMENKKPDKKRVFIGAKSWKQAMGNLVRNCIQDGIAFTYDVACKILPRNGKRVLLMSQTRDRLSENLQVLDNRMKERGMDKEYQISYSITNLLDGGMSPWKWLKTTLAMANKDYIFLDDYTPIFTFVNCDKRTVLTQVWHAGVGFKSCGYSRFGLPNGPHPNKSCHRQYDYAVIGSAGLYEDYREVFGVEKSRFVPSGLPRLDGYLNEDTIQSFRNRFFAEHPEWKGKRIVLFAPTFRGDSQLCAYYDYDQIDFDALYEVCKNDIVLFKMHPFVKEAVPVPEQYKHCMFDYTKYPNINELFYVTDVLISDYSSAIYEFSLFEKPMLFYAYDEDLYAVSRGLYRSLEEFAPGKVCYTFEQLTEALRTNDYALDKLEAFRKHGFDQFDNHNADRVLDTVFKK